MKRRTLDEDLAWLSCDEEKFCKRFDLSLIKNIGLPPPRTREELEAHLNLCVEMARVLRTRENMASMVPLLSVDTVSDGGSFVAWIQLAHATLFKDVFSFAGKTRGATGATVEVDSGPDHAFSGVEPAKVDQQLISLCALIWPPPDEIGAFAYWAANFLQRFFQIHPFSDGNGRTGRLVVSLLADARGFWFAPARTFDDDGILSEEEIERIERRDRKDYLWALRWAHKHRGCSPVSDRLPAKREALGPLRRWLENRLYDYSELAFELEAEPPDWWSDSMEEPEFPMLSDDYVEDAEQPDPSDEEPEGP